MNGKTTVSCAIESGSPPLKFEWQKDGIPLSTSSSYSILTGEEVSSLTFRQLTREDSGNYTCIVSNSDASDSHTAQLLIKCKMNHYD